MVTGGKAAVSDAWQTAPMDERLSRMEVMKDSVQELVEAGASTVGDIASIVTNAVGDVARACGEFATTAFEIRDGARAAASADDPDDA